MKHRYASALKKRCVPAFLLLLLTIFLCVAIQQQALHQERVKRMCILAKDEYSRALYFCSYVLVEYEQQNPESFDHLYHKMSEHCAGLSERLGDLIDHTDLGIQYPLAVEYLFAFCGQITEATNVFESFDPSGLRAKYLLLDQCKGPLEQHDPFEVVLQRLEAALEDAAQA